jgi:chromate reductase
MIMSELALLTICGALRKGSTNRLLLAEAARAFGTARVEEADLRLPLYDNDLEDTSGIPAEVQRLANQIRDADAVIISTPEYNKSLSGVLKNALDWISRVPGSVWRDRPVAIVSAADGRGGGDRAQFALRLCMVAFRPRLLAGPEVMVASSRKAFDADGRLSDPVTVKMLAELMQSLRIEAMR